MDNHHTNKPIRLPKLKIKNVSTSPRRRGLLHNAQVSPYRIAQGISVPRRTTKRLIPLRSGLIPEKSKIEIQDTFMNRILQEPRKIFDRIAQKMIAQKYAIKQFSPTASTIDSINAVSLESHFLEDAIKLTNSNRAGSIQLNREPTMHNLVSTPLFMQDSEEVQSEVEVDKLVDRYLNQESLLETAYPMYNLPYEFSIVNRFILTSKVLHNDLYESDYSSISLEDALHPKTAESPIITKEDQTERMLDYQDMLIKKPHKLKNQCNKPQDFTGKLKRIGRRV